MREKNKESDEWKHKYEHMRHQHEEVIDNLKEANKCYLMQVSENEDLKKQLHLMQQQHIMMMKKFEEIEHKLSQKNDMIRESTQSMMMGSAQKPVSE